MQSFRTFRRFVMAMATVFGIPLCRGELKVGDPAPKLQTGSWVQGDEVKEFEGDKVYMIECWATWCGPCVAAIPHVNGIHKKYQDRGLVVIGQNVWEQDVKGVPDFVKKMADKMTYRVAIDDTSAGGKGSMADGWLKAAGQNGIPCCFIVDKQGKVAFIGHPMTLKEELLEQLLAAPSTKSAVPAGPVADTAAAPTPKALELVRRAAAEIAVGKLDEAEATVAEVNGTLTDKFRYLGGLLDMELLLARKRPDDAIQLGRIIAEDYAGSPTVRIMVAERLISRPDASPALQTAAGKLATPVSTSAGDGQAAALATLARIAMLRNDKAKAIELQTKAVSLSKSTAAAKAALESYQQGRLPDPPAR